MAEQQTNERQGNAHMMPTTSEEEEMSAALAEAVQAIDKVWDIANRTASYYWLLDDIESIVADLVRLQRLD